MPDDVQTAELIPAHLSDTGRDGAPKAAQLRAGAGIAPIIPTTIEEAYRLAVAIVKAGLAPDSYNIGGNGADKDEPDPQKILIGILKSIEVGLPPITGLSTIAIVRKRPCIWGDGAIALVQRTGLVGKVEQRYDGSEAAGADQISASDFPDNFAAVYRIWRRGQEEPYEGRFSVRDAKRAHLWLNNKRPPWIEYPKRMLMARARAFALREGFSDALSGLAIREEVEDLPAEPPPKTAVDFLEDAPAAPVVASAALPAPSQQPMPPVIVTEREKDPVPAAATPSPKPAPKAEQRPQPSMFDAPQGEPPSPAKFPDKAVWRDWIGWAIGQIKTLPKEKLAEFIMRPEFVGLAEKRPNDWDRIQAALDDRRSG